MKRMGKSILALVLAYAMVIGNLGSGAFAAKAVAAEDIFACTNADDADADVFATADDIFAGDFVAGDTAETFAEAAGFAYEDLFTASPEQTSPTQQASPTQNDDEGTGDTETDDTKTDDTGKDDTKPVDGGETTVSPMSAQEKYDLDDETWEDMKGDGRDPLDIAFEKNGTPKLWIGGLEKEYPFTGAKITPEVRVYEGFNRLALKTDYTVKYTNNKKANGTATVKITFKKNYKGTNVAATFKIVPAELGKDVIAIDTAVKASKIKTKPALINVHTGKKVKFSAKLFEFDNSAKTKDKAFTVTYTAKSTNNYKAGSKTSAVITPGAVSVTKPKLKYLNKEGKTKAIAVYTGKDIVVGKMGDTNADLQVELKGINKDYYTIVMGNTASGTQVSGTQTASGTQAASGMQVSFKNPGTGYFIIKGDGKNLVGERIVSFKIQKNKAKMAVDAATGLPKGWTFEIKNGNKLGFNVASAAQTASGTQVVSGTQAASGTQAVSAMDAAYYDSSLYFVKSKKNMKPQDVVLCDAEGNRLTMGVDFTIKAKSVAAGKDGAVFTIKMKGKKYKGTFTVKKDVKAIDLSDSSLIAVEVVESNKVLGKKTKVNVYSLVDGTKLKVNKDYTIDKTGTKITITANGSNFTNKVVVDYRQGAQTIKKAKFTVAKQTFNGMPVTLKEGADSISKALSKKKGAAIKLGTDYEIVGYMKNRNKGTAKAIIKGKGSFVGYQIKSFKIVPNGTKKNPAPAENIYR